MRAGKLTHVIKVQQYDASAVNEYGTPVPTWTDLATLRAEVVEQTAEEFIRDARATTETAIVFRTRFLDGVKTADRVRFDGTDFNIREVTPIGRRKGMELRCIAIGDE
ncbi:phage head closure protein [Tranquillimonas alkanivorans]|uniref:Phage head-tail adaptor, putative, SPP1 family n=1 Tax=Tranquillimonas alkanivorans TaxID=441119 RepID=A0A1I5RW19_9RHOB|nr:phage head closure protein [Tranquillimonas alkanivorans]SFP62643.1 phage head-tail adaptor, putative, SPP1 family [Tranquillimonas alkanivorans]